LALLLGALGGRAVATARARTAADAAALAGAVGGEPAALEVAAANGARLLRFEVVGEQAEVQVQVQGATATARAERTPSLAAERGGTTGTVEGLQPAMVAALRRAEALLGEPVPITSGWRSPAEQQRLWDARATNPYPVARPGTSRHERGVAVDVPRGFVPRLRTVAAAAGLCFPLPVTDPVHFELCPGAG
jgi:uncharacterized protein YcbK (DUF882 family)